MKTLDIRGAGGGGGESQRQPREAKNTLQSTAKAKILDLIQYGKMLGPVKGLQSIFLDGTPLQNPDGTMNFEGIRVQFRAGEPDQEVIEGFRGVENTQDVSTEVKYGVPIVRSVTNPDADAAVVTIQLQGLSKQNSSGDLLGHSVTIAIEWSVDGGPWTRAVQDTISGKTMSPYQRSYRINFGQVNGTVNLRVSRISEDDDDDSGTTSSTFWASFVEIIDRKLNYPEMALVGIEVDAREFGNKMPSREYEMYLSEIQIPSNYDPTTREYSGIWDGTFKMSWSDNPAWAFYDLATHPVIGAGMQNVDKWVLYRIGQYCDELVPNGKGGMEPRFTINTLFAKQEDAITALNTLASIFRGMVYWGSDAVTASADMPEDPVKLVTPANVKDGDFTYTGTSLKERHSVAVVMYNDPDNNYEATPLVWEDPDSMRLFGYRETKVTAVGCTSRGQALRLAKWILYSERMETETVTYTTSVDHADLRPGNIIKVMDPSRAGARLGGRVKVTGLDQLTLDAVPEGTDVGTWYLSVVLPDGVIQKVEVEYFEGNTVYLLTDLASEPSVGAMWVLSSTSLELPEFRVVSVREDGIEFHITATEYHRSKYSEVELGLKIPETPDSLIPSGSIPAVTGLEAAASTYLAGGASHQKVSFSWSPSPDPRVLEYVLELWGPEETTWRTAYAGPGLMHEELDAEAGQWMARVKAVNGLGVSSQWVAATVNVAHLLLPVKPDYVDFSIGTFSISLRPRSSYPGAMYEFWRSDAPLTTDLIESNAVKLSVSTDLVDTGLRSATTYYYYIRGANAYGVSDWLPAQATTGEDFDDILDAVDTEIRRPGGLFEQMVEESSSAVADGVGDIVAGQVESAVTEVKDDVSALKVSTYLESIRHAAAMAMGEGASARAAVEEAVRASEDADLSMQITSLASTVGDNKAELDQTILTLADADSALAAQISELQAQVGGDISAALAQEAQARADADSALSSQVSTLTTQFNDNSAAVQDSLTTLSDADSALAAQITALQTKVDDDISAAISQEQIARADGDSALAAQITSLESQMGTDIAAAVQVETSARTTADSALAAQITALQAQVDDDISAAISQEQIARADGDSALAAQITSLESQMGTDIAAAVQVETSARTTADSALAAQITALQAQVDDDISAAISQEQIARADGDSALAAQITSLESQMGTDIAAAVQVETSARTTADSALAAQITALESSTGDQFASVQQQFTAATEYTDGAVARAVTTAEVNGKKAVFGIQVDGEVSEIGAVADRFYVYNPVGNEYKLAFAVVNGQTVIETAMIGDASITAAKIAEAAIGSLQLSEEIQSDNYVAGTTGWRLTKSGQFEINGTIAGSGRTTITNLGVSVFDSNGVKRVQLGKLD